jgi:hypothetical protein
LTLALKVADGVITSPLGALVVKRYVPQIKSLIFPAKAGAYMMDNLMGKVNEL